MVAIILAAVGICGVMSFSVSQRTVARSGLNRSDEPPGRLATQFREATNGFTMETVNRAPSRAFSASFFE